VIWTTEEGELLSSSGPPKDEEGLAGGGTVGRNQNMGYLRWMLLTTSATARVRIDERQTMGRRYQDISTTS
jgi:hypothetical protein